jgi:hypothetical protein
MDDPSVLLHARHETLGGRLFLIGSDDHETDEVARAPSAVPADEDGTSPVRLLSGR